MSFFISNEKKPIIENKDNWQDIIDIVDIQKIISNQEKAHPIRLKIIESLDTIIENQKIILSHIDTINKKINNMENSLSKQINNGLFSSYLRPTKFPYLNQN